MNMKRDRSQEGISDFSHRKYFCGKLLNSIKAYDELFLLEAFDQKGEIFDILIDSPPCRNSAISMTSSMS